MVLSTHNTTLDKPKALLYLECLVLLENCVLQLKYVQLLLSFFNNIPKVFCVMINYLALFTNH